MSSLFKYLIPFLVFVLWASVAWMPFGDIGKLVNGKIWTSSNALDCSVWLSLGILGPYIAGRLQGRFFPDN